MQIEITETPFHVELLGKSGMVPNGDYGEVGRPLMDEMWKAIQDHGIQNSGVNHWVYLGNSEMFVGVEPAADAGAGSLKRLSVTMERHARHVHVGPYDQLPQKWKSLTAEISQRDEVIKYPSIEIYGHWQQDPDKLETTILIGLQ